MLKLFRWCRARRKRLAVTLLAVPLVLVNVVAYIQARAFTHFAPAGTATGNIQALDRWGKLRVLLTGVTIPRPENRSTPADLGLPFTTLAIAGDGVALEAWHIPVERPRGLVLLFHGHA